MKGTRRVKNGKACHLQAKQALALLETTHRCYEIQIHLDIVGATKGADDSEGPPAPLLN